MACRIALSDIGVQARMGLIKEVRFLYGVIPYNVLLVKLIEVWLQQIEAGLASKEKLITNAPSKQNEVMQSRNSLVSKSLLASSVSVQLDVIQFGRMRD